MDFTYLDDENVRKNAAMARFFAEGMMTMKLAARLLERQPEADLGSINFGAVFATHKIANLAAVLKRLPDGDMDLRRMLAGMRGEVAVYFDPPIVDATMKRIEYVIETEDGD